MNGTDFSIIFITPQKVYSREKYVQRRGFMYKLSKNIICFKNTLQSMVKDAEYVKILDAIFFIFYHQRSCIRPYFFKIYKLNCYWTLTRVVSF